jgi:hypothetical protein
MAEKREMTEEIRREMLGWLSFSPDSTIDFAPKDYLPKNAEGKIEARDELLPYFATYQIRSFKKGENILAQKLRAELMADKENKNLFEHFQRMRDLVRPCIMGSRDNFDLGTMKEDTYRPDPQGGMDKAQFDKIPDIYIWPMWGFINRISGITPGESLSLK